MHSKKDDLGDLFARIAGLTRPGLTGVSFETEARALADRLRRRDFSLLLLRTTGAPRSTVSTTERDAARFILLWMSGDANRGPLVALGRRDAEEARRNARRWKSMLDEGSRGALNAIGEMTALLARGGDPSRFPPKAAAMIREGHRRFAAARTDTERMWATLMVISALLDAYCARSRAAG